MSQDFTDNVYDSSFNVLTTMENVEKNFAALKSSFSGTSSPSNTVAGMWWFDTTNNLLKLRNEANTAWLSVWDLANNKPIITNLSDEITVGMINSALKNPAAGSYGLRSLGTTSVSACAGNDSRLSDTRIPTNSSVSQAKLKTATGEVSAAVDATTTVVARTGNLPGGEYGFRVTVKKVGTGTIQCEGYFDNSIGTGYASLPIQFRATSGSGTGYAQERYVQSSGEIHWIFYLRNRQTGLIEKGWQAPDHCCFGNGGDPERFQHPYGDYDQDKYELIVINPPLNLVREWKKRAGAHEAILALIEKEYVIDDSSSPPWPSKSVTVGLPGDWDERWLLERQGISTDIKTIKSKIPKPKQAVTRVLKKKIR